MRSPYLLVGLVGAPYGVKGWVKIQSFTYPFNNILNYNPWFLKKDSINLNLSSFSPIRTKVNIKTVYALFNNINDRDKVSTLTGAEIYILREQLPILPSGDFYWADLEGLQVYTIDKKFIGFVDSLFSNGVQDIMIIKNNKLNKNKKTAEYLIPYLKNVVHKVDLEKKEIWVDWFIETLDY